MQKAPIRAGLIWLAVVLISFLSGILSQWTSHSFCVFQALFHIPCAFCGMTRGFFAILRLDFVGAFRWNILSVPLFFVITLFPLVCLSDLFLRTTLVTKIQRFISKKPIWISLIVIFLLNFVRQILNAKSLGL